MIKPLLNTFTALTQKSRRDYRFLGTIGLFDELYLPLRRGENELWLAVSEDFGGWGVKAMFEDSSGITVK